MTKLIKLIDEQKICGMVFGNADIDLPKNRLNPCCLYKDFSGKVSDGVTNVWFNEHYKNLRQQWIDNKLPTGCTLCKETNTDPNIFSLKNQKNKLFKDNFDFTYNTDVESPRLPSVFNIHTTNTCNLACRMCNPVDSSLLDSIVRKNDILRDYFYVPDYKNKVNVESLRGSFKNAEFVSFLGGEPMLQEANIEEIIKMIQEESTNLKLINITTNMTILNHELLKKLSDLDKTVMLSISIDGPKKIHDYIRYKGKWDTIIENIKFVSSNYPNFKLAINTTVSVLTVGYITDLLDELGNLQNQGIKIIKIMPFPVVKTYLHCDILPKSVKETYLQKINTYENVFNIRGSDSLLRASTDLLNGSNNHSPDIHRSIDDFVRFINEFDRIAGTKTTDVYPEFKSFMN
jgi:sulfatase maturation enzyme AslB (radical SAM superfamily)